MRARSSRFLLVTLSLLLAAPAGVAAQEVGHGGVGQEGVQVPAPGVPEVSLGSRFTPLQGPTGIPMLGLRVGAWSGGGLGLRYSSSGPYAGNPHELEFSVKQRLLSEERGSPVSASFLGAVNTGAYSLDGELAVSRDLGPLTLLGTARLLGNADGARLPLGGFGAGARLGILPQLALVGDVFQVVNNAGAVPAWGAGVQMQLPASPYAVTLHVANTPSSTRQGASLGTSDLRFGIDMAMVFPGWSSHRALAAAPVQVAEKPRGEAATVQAEKPAAPLPERVVQAPQADATSTAPPAVQPPAAPNPAPVPAPAKAATSKPVSPTAPRAAAPVRVAQADPAVRPKPKATPKPQVKPASSAKPRVKAAVKPAAIAKSSSKPGPAKPGAARSESELWIVMIRDGQPSPAEVRLSRGSSVTWFNRDATEHALSAAGWESGTLAPGAQITRRFDHVGAFRYQCRLHPNEGGTVTVR